MHTAWIPDSINPFPVRWSAVTYQWHMTWWVFNGYFGEKLLETCSKKPIWIERNLCYLYHFKIPWVPFITIRGDSHWRTYLKKVLKKIHYKVFVAPESEVQFYSPECHLQHTCPANMYQLPQESNNTDTLKRAPYLAWQHPLLLVSTTKHRVATTSGREHSPLWLHVPEPPWIWLRS